MLCQAARLGHAGAIVTAETTAHPSRASTESRRASDSVSGRFTDRCLDPRRRSHRQDLVCSSPRSPKSAPTSANINRCGAMPHSSPHNPSSARLFASKDTHDSPKLPFSPGSLVDIFSSACKAAELVSSLEPQEAHCIVLTSESHSDPLLQPHSPTIKSNPPKPSTTKPLHFHIVLRTNGILEDAAVVGRCKDFVHSFSASFFVLRDQGPNELEPLLEILADRVGSSVHLLAFGHLQAVVQALPRLNPSSPERAVRYPPVLSITRFAAESDLVDLVPVERTHVLLHVENNDATLYSTLLETMLESNLVAWVSTGDHCPDALLYPSKEKAALVLAILSDIQSPLRSARIKTEPLTPLACESALENFKFESLVEALQTIRRLSQQSALTPDEFGLLEKCVLVVVEIGELHVLFEPLNETKQLVSALPRSESLVDRLNQSMVAIQTRFV
ncbi:uncharacterized protein BJ171DRAFT_507160 [Polychytrium aggregatum]|uniref:uncharacterized protein n=1 Tax=Polychytrium aggregatum TaxID=110093 RepID=UPI0022FF2F41|nr:uncharacterized protein BJ171DRAFT_507160 [Polychytrium aggregatum]KAI9203965.1 hypothetical protein BJ171DRAFT_507160 [Polychytrium aggregatum]